MNGPGKSPFASLERLRDKLPPGEPERDADRSHVEPEPTSADPRFEAKIVVRRERKGRGGKTVTLVQGLRLNTSGLDGLARELRKALGCGGGLEPGRDGVTEICLQGDVADRVVAWLEARGARRVVRSG